MGIYLKLSKKNESSQHVIGWAWKYKAFDRLCPEISPDIVPVLIKKLISHTKCTQKCFTLTTMNRISVYVREEFWHNRWKSYSFQAQPITCCALPVFFMNLRYIPI